MASFAESLSYTKVSGDTIFDVDIDGDGVYLFAHNGKNIVMRTYPLRGGAHVSTVTALPSGSISGQINAACRVGTSLVVIDNRNVRVFNAQGVQTSITGLRNDALDSYFGPILRGIDYDVSTNPDSYIFVFSAVTSSPFARDQVILARLGVSLPDDFSSAVRIDSGDFDDAGMSLGKSGGGVYVYDPDRDELREYSNSFAYVDAQAISQVDDFRGVGFHDTHILVVDDSDFHYYGEAPALPNVSPVWTTTVTSYTLNVNPSSGDTVATVRATDEDVGAVLTYSLTGTHRTLFAISSGGVITVAGALSNGTTYNINAVVSDGTVSVPLALTVRVRANTAPTISTTQTTYNLAADSADGTVVVNVQASDSDAGDSLTYDLSGTNESLFAISDTGVLTIDGTVTNGTTYNVTVIVSDVAGLTDTLALMVVIAPTPVTNTAPRWLTSQTNYTLGAGVSTGAGVANLSATDADNDTLTYTLTGDDESLFAISSGGVVTVDGALVNGQTYNFNAVVSDGTVSATLGLVVVVGSNTAPVWDTTVVDYSLGVNIPAGRVVSVLQASDADDDTLTYSLTGTDESKFSISSSGVLSTAEALVNQTTYSFNAVVTDGTDTVTLALTVSAGFGYTPPVRLERQIEGLEEYQEGFDVVRQSDPIQIIAVDAEMIRQTAASLIAFLGVDTPGVTKQLSRLLITPVNPIREVELGDKIFLHEGIGGLVPTAIPTNAWTIVGFLSVADSLKQTFVCESP